MLTEIAISNFRGFGELKLSPLGKVNLIVGRNNVGKTSLLEAIRITATAQNNSDLVSTFRTAQNTQSSKWLVRDGTGIDKAELSTHDIDGSSSRVRLSKTKNPEKSVGFDERGWDGVIHFLASKNRKPKEAITISTNQRKSTELVGPFTDATRAGEGERQLESLLQAVDPKIRAIRLSLVGNPDIVIDLGLSERVPLNQAGQGISRLVGIFSELLGQRPEICFIDEIENGIYHGSLKEVWKGIAEVSERLNVQVFATTHSWECIIAAHEAFSERSNYDLKLIQLYRVDDKAEGRLLDRDLIIAGIEGNIDLR